MSAQDILVVGSVALDSLETPFGHRDECLGGSATYFSVSASFFAPVKIVAVVGEDFPEPYLDHLRARGVNLDGLERVAGGQTFRWCGRYGENLNEAQTLETQLNVFQDFDPKIPEGWLASELLFLGNIDPDLQLRVLEKVPAPHVVAADTMNFWIIGKRDALEQVLTRVDVLLINETEARLLSGEHNIVRAADAIRAMGPATLVIKRGEYGAMLFHAGGTFIAPALPLRSVVDPTGAGDSFAGGLMGYLARAGDTGFASLQRGILAGTVMASFACEGFSLDRLLALDPREVDERVAELETLISLAAEGV